jgi:Ca2+/Na+ antiporter
VLTFRDQQRTASIDVLLVKDKSYEGDESFQVIFSDATGGATFHPDSNGYPQRAFATVVITCDDPVDCGSALLVRFCGFNSDVCALVMEAWYAQFEDALTYDRDGSLLGHLVALPWKLFFALAPPTALAGGWACFVVALSMIGILTALIGDLASHLGCCLGISKAITAITFVAVGTSLPDTFASMKAAREEEYADASLGNVTGSNSVNVFLGLGLPWAMAAVYWSAPSFFPYIWGGHPEESTWRVRYAGESWYNDGMPLSFAVPAGDLGYTVFMFLLCAMVTLGIIFLRRAVFGVELGGPQPWASLTFVVFAGLWVFYLSACIVNGT